MPYIKTEFEGLFIFEPKIFKDDRGYFFESFNARTLEIETKQKYNFVQDNESKSTKGVLRGMHYQINPMAQAKLVRVLEGEVQDVVVDLRKNSKTYGKQFSIVLTAENKKQLLIPKGFAHGFLVLSETATFFYKCDNFYSKEHERSLAWNDKTLNINWLTATENLILSEKDREALSFNDAEHNF